MVNKEYVLERWICQIQKLKKKDWPFMIYADFESILVP